MALALKVIAQLALTATSEADLTDDVTSGKALLVKSMRFTNTNSSGSVTVNVLFKRGTGTSRQLLPKNLSLTAGATFVDDSEVVLEEDDALRYAVSGNGVDCLVFGIERDA